MARRGNYGVEKRQKELKKQKKKAEKVERQRLKKLGNLPDETEVPGEDQSGAADDDPPSE